jgi:hypothetical protein
MRTAAAALFAAAGLALAGCNPTVTFDSTVHGSSTVPGSALGSLGGPLNLTGFNNINFSQQAALQNNNTDKNHLDHVRVKSLLLTVTSPSGSDLSFLTSLAFSIEAPGVAKAQIAHQTTFPKGQAAVQMLIDAVDLTPYAKADSLTITSAGAGTSPAQDTTIDINLVLTIDAHLL